jgi:hypothetical protein
MLHKYYSIDKQAEKYQKNQFGKLNICHRKIIICLRGFELQCQQLSQFSFL